MQSIQKILENVTQQQTCSVRPVMSTIQNQKEEMSSSSKDTYKVEKRIDLLFSKFAAFYGHVWRSQFKDEVFFKFAKKEWQEALTEFTDEEITKAILSCREFYEMPPTLPQVIQCCRQLKKQTFVDVAKEMYVPANPAVVRACLQQCREFLAK
jgi:hypothetical protein